MTAPTSSPASPKLSITDIRVIRTLIQLVFLIGMTLLFAVLINNGRIGLQRIGLTPSFDFLDNPSNMQISEGLVNNPHVAQDSFAHAFLIGVINTLRVVVIGLILTTIFGVLVGIARLSTNWLIRTLATIYIEIMQNTPLLVQLVFIYAIFLSLPRAQESIVLPGPSYISVRGFAMPGLWPTDSTAVWTILVLVAGVIGFIIWRTRRRIQIETGKRTYAFELGAGLLLAAAILSWIILRPYAVSYPELLGPRYNPQVGVVVSIAFSSITLGLVLYTSAFVAEIIRSGIQSVPNGQWEAARSQGFGYFQTLRLIVLPQAFRVAIPPLTNQYLNLIKNSSLGAVVGYADIFGVGKIGFESGQTVPVVVIVIVLYLTLDLFTAFLMNLINQRAQFKVR
ncbi:MAG: ABC transporter permease subunit [Anaerolineae bacterium]|nr:ABC transporter permease subunit [Anaerolineae bacterium]